MDFSEGGYWLYAMKGPDGTDHWSRADFKSITPMKQFTALDAFCDAEGNINKEMAGSFWKIYFKESSVSTIVSIEIKFESLADLEQIVEMGFKEGFAAGLENLENLLVKL
ncbi:MAG: SRPBCC domain-containing protein [Bacteroidales bacterium]